MGMTDIQLWSQDDTISQLLGVNTIWQRRFWDHVIRNDLDLEEKLNYINYNAVKHGLVSDPVDYKYSSARNYYLGDDSVIKIDRI